MTNEEFQKLMLEKMENMDIRLSKIEQSTDIRLGNIEQSMDRRLSNIEQSMATKDDIAKLERLANGAMEIIEQTYREVEKIGEVQLVQGETITILANRQLQTESKVAVLGKAKIG